jgi:SAM-dependent methyltransferase
MGDVMSAALPQVYDDPERYDLVFESLDFDVPFWLEVGRDAGGPVLELGCGTGRVMLRLLEAGCDVDGVDLHPAMLERLRAKAAAKGWTPQLVTADMQDFTMPRRYRRVICPFNAFAHAETTEAQLATLACVRQHLEPDGAFVVFMSYPGHRYWSAPDADPVLELETRGADPGRRIQIWDQRTKDPVAQHQHSIVEYRELDEANRVIGSSRFETSVRWVYRYELELLFRLAGFARWEVFGGFGREPLTRDDQPMIAWAWRS